MSMKAKMTTEQWKYFQALLDKADAKAHELDVQCLVDALRCLAKNIVRVENEYKGPYDKVVFDRRALGPFVFNPGEDRPVQLCSSCGQPAARDANNHYKQCYNEIYEALNVAEKEIAELKHNNYRQMYYDKCAALADVTKRMENIRKANEYLDKTNTNLRAANENLNSRLTRAQAKLNLIKEEVGDW